MASARFAELDAFVMDKMIKSRLPGVTLALVEGGAVVHRRGMGFMDLQTRIPPDPQTLFGQGSVTKVFTSLAIMQLHDQGKLDIQDSIDKYLDFPIRPFGEQVRIWHFLTHSSGIPGLGWSESKMSHRWFMDGFPIGGPDDVLSFMRDAEGWAHARPGERWMYLNEGYILLGLIIEKVSGQEYVDYIRDRVLLPIGMENTFFRREDVERHSNRATPYLKDRDGRFFRGENLYGRVPAAGGLVSSADDMARLVQMLVNGGKSVTGETVLRPEILELAMEPRVPTPPKPDPAFSGLIPGGNSGPEGGNFHSYAFQVNQGFFGERVVGHGGGVMGGTSYMCFIPERQVGVAIQGNGHAYPMGQLAMFALAELLGENPRRLPFLQSAAIMESLAGAYQSYRGTMEALVSRRGDFLEFRLNFKHEERVVTLVPLDLHPESPRFFTLSGGRRVIIEFDRTAEGVNLLYERYKFRKTGGA